MKEGVAEPSYAPPVTQTPANQVAQATGNTEEAGWKLVTRKSRGTTKHPVDPTTSTLLIF